MSRFIEEIKQVKEDAILVSNLIYKGIKWLSKNGDESLKNSKIQMLDDNVRKLNKVISASLKRPSVAVFGQSQVGKSFLVRTLAQSPINNKLEVLNADSKIDFIQKINPPGGRESTGIITRFTTKKSDSNNANYPFKIELLNQLDIAAIIANGYIEDIKDYEDDFDKELVLNELLNIDVEQNEYSDISKHDISNFNDFILSNYKEDFRIRDYKSIGYFELLIKKLPYLSFDNRYKFLQYLWGKNDFLTNLFNLLSQTLKNIDFSDVGFLSDDAIINDINLSKEFSLTSNILDVERVKEIFKNKQLPNVNICTKSGAIKTVSRSILCALIKELQFEIPDHFENDKQRSFLLEADLLDFPGSKSRDKIPEKVFKSNSETEKLSLFVRGKVSYLFYLYNRDIGISSLLYCMDNEPPLVADSPALLENWISKYVGNSPKQRNEFQKSVTDLFKKENISFEAEHFSPLLVAMTKFNIELAGKGDADIIGEPSSHDAKWFARFQENFSAYMSKPVGDKWTENWTKNDDYFNFLFPIRDPNFSTSIFDGYELNGIEQTVRPEKIKKLEDMKTSFLSSTIVDKYIIDKNELWNEITTPRNTGLNYLCKYLAPSAHPANFIAQLKSLLKNVVNSNLEILGPEFISGNMDEDLKIAKRKGAQAFTAILTLNTKENTPLVDFMDLLSVSETEIWKLLYEYKFSNKINENTTVNTIDLTLLKSFLESIGLNFEDFQNIGQIKDSLLDFYGVPENELNDILDSQLGFKLSDFKSNIDDSETQKSNFCDDIILFWSKKINAQSIDDVLQKKGANNSTIESLKLLTNEIVKSKSIIIVKDKINEILNVKFQNNISKDQFNLIASCICSILNNYTFSVAWSYSNDDKKPRIPISNSAIFKNVSVLNDISILNSDLLEPKVSEYLTHFSIGAKEIFSENVRLNYGLEDTFNQVANLEVASIINDLKATL